MFKEFLSKVSGTLHSGGPEVVIGQCKVGPKRNQCG